MALGLAGAPPFGRRADGRALERSIKSTLWAENVPLWVCVCVSVRVRAAVCPDIFLRLGPLREGNVVDSPGVEIVRVCVRV